MFARVTDASKIAAAHLARFLEEEGFGMIDCQMNTAHLASLGAREIPRAISWPACARWWPAVAAWPMAGRRRQPSLELAHVALNDSDLPFSLLQFYATAPTPAATWRASGRVRRSPRQAI
jgi:hypothetical protein